MDWISSGRVLPANKSELSKQCWVEVVTTNSDIDPVVLADKKWRRVFGRLDVKKEAASMRFQLEFRYECSCFLSRHGFMFYRMFFCHCWQWHFRFQKGDEVPQSLPVPSHVLPVPLEVGCLGKQQFWRLHWESTEQISRLNSKGKKIHVTPKGEELRPVPLPKAW